jgi:signal peptidase I
MPGILVSSKDPRYFGHGRDWGEKQQNAGDLPGGAIQSGKASLEPAKMQSMTVEHTTEPLSPAAPAAKSSWRVWWENAQILFVAIILALLVRAFVAEPRYIPSDSMYPTLEIGDRLVVEKISYYFHAPEPGEIVVFDPPPQLQRQGYAKDQAFIKRIVAIPGQTIEVRDGTVYVDRQPLTEPYIAEPPAYTMTAVQVPENTVFVMGDNRNNSNDSHVWGFLPQQNIIGHAWLRFFPYTKIGRV